ncbi:MAG: heme biosynthesis protein HemY [Haliea sp.]|nr:heme biosynthesis protein HemY [Haliea sp.]|tara:strand:+ start:42613 stop:43866 length:1254 start_codon:yes stop_codon:yes gene_type:complete
MRRLLLLALLGLLAGVGLIALIETDPGYVLLAWGHYTVETSIWVGLALLLLLVLLLYAAVGLLRRLWRGQRQLRGWLGGRRARRASRITSRGLIDFIEGNWSTARRRLLRAAPHSDAPLLNYLIAARASHALGDNEKMREYLGAAEQADAEAGIAVELTQAELKLQSGQYEQAVATLERARRNAGRHPHVLKLLHRAYLGLQDWEQLEALLPDLRKHHVLPAEELQALQQRILEERLQACLARGEQAGEALQQYWQRVPKAQREDRELLLAYLAALVRAGAHEVAGKLIERRLKSSWDSDLARLYGYVEMPDATRQLARAEGWLEGHRQDPQLLLSLGRLACREQLWEQARDYFEAAYTLKPSPELCAELGRLLHAQGAERESAAFFREGLLLREKSLPHLPLPDLKAAPRLVDQRL